MVMKRFSTEEILQLKETEQIRFYDEFDGTDYDGSLFDQGFDEYLKTIGLVRIATDRKSLCCVNIEELKNLIIKAYNKDSLLFNTLVNDLDEPYIIERLWDFHYPIFQEIITSSEDYVNLQIYVNYVDFVLETVDNIKA